MKSYTIKKVNGKPSDWSGIEKAKIDIYKWAENDYRPRTEAAICYDEEAIYIKFWAYETEIRAEHKNHNENVCEDSCVEFFFRTNSHPSFLNIETTVIGKQLIGFGKDRHVRLDVPVEDDVMQIIPSVRDAENYSDDMWTVEYRVPFSFLKKFYGDINVIEDGLRANLYKCGDFTKFEHFGMWNEVDYMPPDFHRPEFFGEMIFEK